MIDKHKEALYIGTLQRVAHAFHPHAAWGTDNKLDMLVDGNGTICADINDYLLTVFHSNGRRSHYSMDTNGEAHCYAVHEAGA